MKHRYVCKRCGCALDPAEMPYCEDCRQEIREEEKYRKRWAMSAEAYQTMKKELRGA